MVHMKFCHTRTYGADPVLGLRPFLKLAEGESVGVEKMVAAASDGNGRTAGSVVLASVGVGGLLAAVTATAMIRVATSGAMKGGVRWQ